MMKGVVSASDHRCVLLSGRGSGRRRHRHARAARLCVGRRWASPGCRVLRVSSIPAVAAGSIEVPAFARCRCQRRPPLMLRRRSSRRRRSRFCCHRLRRSRQRLSRRGRRKQSRAARLRAGYLLLAVAVGQTGGVVLVFKRDRRAPNGERVGGRLPASEPLARLI